MHKKNPIYSSIISYSKEQPSNTAPKYKGGFLMLFYEINIDFDSERKDAEDKFETNR